MRIEILTFKGCPNGPPTVQMVRDVALELGQGAMLHEIDVDSPMRASELGFLGSPSVRINGRDLEGDPPIAPGIYGCRVYGSSGVPPRWLVEASVLRAAPPQRLLFLCVANSARSQLAEGLARSLAPDGVSVYSAGSAPTTIRPETIAVLAEIGIDASAQQAKSVDALDGVPQDLVVTLCDGEACPTVLQPVRHIHWGLPDPAAVEGNDEARLDAFRQIREELLRRLRIIWPR